MSILTGPEIKKRVESGSIVIKPFNVGQLNPNSYKVCLGPQLKCYRRPVHGLDSFKQNETASFDIPESGFVLQPGRLYLACTAEYTETHNAVPQIQGRSSIGRLGIFVHVTAGFGDVGFCGQWTLELAVVEPVRVYAGMEIAQLVYHETVGEVVHYNGRYQGGKGPEASRLWQV